MKKSIISKIDLLNQTTLHSILEENKFEIVKKFTDASINIFNADFGHSFWYSGNKYESIYRSSVEQINGNLKNKITIPVNFGDHVYGKIILYFRKNKKLSEEEQVLSDTLANTIAQAVTIRWLIESERTAIQLAEKQKATEILLAQEKLKTEFITNATHELRTPLAIMNGNVDLALMNKADSKLAHTSLKAVSTEINILSSILKDLSLFNSGQNIKAEMKFVPINICDFLGTLVKRLGVKASKENIKLKIISKNDPNLMVSGDEKYLEKLFLNLLKNAITYGRNKGNVTIDISQEKKTIVVKIIDDGIGISKEDLPKIFERFFRGEKSLSHKAYGKHSGLGLPIAKWAAEIHGGTIKVESILGRGSTFMVTLPLLS